MKEEITLNTNELSEEERKVLEYSSAFEVHFYNVTGAKQYTFPKNLLEAELQRDCEAISDNILKAQNNACHPISGIGVAILAGLIMAVVSNPVTVIIPTAIYMITSRIIMLKKLSKKVAKLEDEQRVKSRLLLRLKEASEVEQAEEMITLKETEVLNENKQNKTQEVNQEKGNISLEVNASSDIIAQTDDKARNISDAAVGAKTEEKTQESPKQMIKGKNN